MKSYSYHGYSTTDFYRIDPRYGTIDEYKELQFEAQKRGIKIIQDMIENHCGSNHWWMEELPFDDWINNNGKYKQTSHRHETVQDPYASDYDKRQFNDGWFVRSMPDLNQRNPYLAEYLIQNSIWWIEEIGLNGARQDTYPYADKEFMANWTKAIMREYPRFNIVGEEWNYEAARIAYWQRGKSNSDGYRSELPSVMDFPMQKAICDALRDPKPENREKLNDLYRCLANDFQYADPQNLVVFVDNHDMDRFFGQIDEDLDMWKLGMTYLMVTRGIPQILYGTEILMNNGKDPRHGIIRSDFPGGWQGDDRDAFRGIALTEHEAEAQLFLRHLINWRKKCSAVHTGELMHFAPENDEEIYTLFRWNSEEIIMLIMNRGNEEKNVNLEKYQEIIAGYSQAINVLTSELIEFKGSRIALQKHSVILLSIKH